MLVFFHMIWFGNDWILWNEMEENNRKLELSLSLPTYFLFRFTPNLL